MLNMFAKKEVLEDYLNYIEDFDDTSLTIFDYNYEPIVSYGCLSEVCVECLKEKLIIASEECGTTLISYNEISLVIFIEGDKKPKNCFFFKNQDAYQIF